MPRAIICTRELHQSGGPGLFVLGRSEESILSLLQEYAQNVQLIYLDPPFGTGDLFRMRIGGTLIQRPAYTDILSQDAYLHMMRNVLLGCHELLAPKGSIYLHVDYRMAAPLRMMMDELFGAGNFMNEIIWMYKSGGRSTTHFSRKHDTILFYRKSRDVYFNIEAVGLQRGPERRNHMKRTIDDKGRVCYSIRSGGRLYTYYEDSLIYPSDVWTDIEHLHQRDPERNGYATQKPEALLNRIMLASSRPGDLVADLFSGSGTTAAVASKTGRRFLACDSSPFALYALRSRQCTLHNALNLFHSPQPLELRFPATKPDAKLCATARLSGETYLCDVQSYTAGDGINMLAYCALGTMDGETFLPAVYACAPTLPLSLHMPNTGYPPVLHTVDVDGRQGFFELSDN